MVTLAMDHPNDVCEQLLGHGLTPFYVPVLMRVGWCCDCTWVGRSVAESKLFKALAGAIRFEAQEKRLLASNKEFFLPVSARGSLILRGCIYPNFFQANNYQ